MPRHQLLITNPKITLKRSKNGKTYFLILDQDTNQVYYAFPSFIKKRRAWTSNQFLQSPKSLNQIRGEF